MWVCLLRMVWADLDEGLGTGDVARGVHFIAARALKIEFDWAVLPVNFQGGCRGRGLGRWSNIEGETSRGSRCCATCRMLIEEDFIKIWVANRVTKGWLTSLITTISLIRQVKQLVRVIRALPNYSTACYVEIFLRKSATFFISWRWVNLGGVLQCTDCFD